MEEKKNFWHTARDWVMGATAVVLTAVGAKYVAEKIQQDKKQQTSEWLQNGSGASIEKGKYVDDDPYWADRPTPGSKEDLMVKAAKEFIDNIKVERLYENKSKKDGLDNLDFVEEKGAYTVYDEQGKEITKLSRHHLVRKDEGMSITLKGKTLDFSDAADALRAKSERLQQKKNDIPAPESKVADDKNKEAVLPKQPQLTSVRSKGGRKGGESLGA